MAPVLIVAATSARMLAESARRGGLRPIALDLFGDVDTRRAARWIGIGNRTRSAIDAQRLHSVITRLARQPQVRGWVVGGGFEDRLELLQDCARTLTLLGNEPAVIGFAKQPADFFRILDRHGIEHPETSLVAPATSSGWLTKRVGGTGGWHVRRLETGHGRPEPHPSPAAMAVVQPTRLSRRAMRSQPVYFQREEGGTSMSALFLANGTESIVVGCNLLLVGAVGERPFVFQGAVGPVALPASADKAVRHAIACVTRHIGLRGLNSLDFLLDGERASVIEVNPRPSATMELHDHRVPGGLLNAHLSACTARTLPPEPSHPPSTVWGTQIIYARRRLVTSRPCCQRLQSLGWCHDIGREGTRTARGDPLCSISAEAASTDAAVGELTRRARDIQSIYEEENDH